MVGLESADGRDGDVAVGAGRRVGDGAAGEPESALEVAYGLAVLTRGQGVETNSPSSCSSWPLPLAPTSRFCTSPSLKTSSVGMLMTL